MSTVAPLTGPHELLVLTTVMVNVSGRPCLFSRMSLRMKSESDGYGPIVSFGDTTHVAVDVTGGVVVVVVVVVVVAVAVPLGLVGVSPLHADDSAALATPSSPSASRRLHDLLVLACDISELESGRVGIVVRLQSKT